MISFRHHVVTLVAVFLALAVGVVLGAGPLSDVGLGAAGELKEERRHSQDLAQEVRMQEAALAYAGGLTRTLGGATLDGKLEGRSVSVVRFPGSEDKMVEQLRTAVTDAGGSVTGTISVQPALLAPAEKALVDTLSSQLATQTEAGVPADASTYDRTGQLLARVIASGGTSSQPVDGAATAILQGMQGAELLGGKAPARRAPLVLVVLGDELSAEKEPIVTGLLTGLAAGAHGVVVAGSTASAAGGALHRVRTQEDAAMGSSVDGAETATGQISTVLALAAAYDGTTGDYGASGSDGTPPLG